jgi:hypothetical protein
MRFSLLCAAVLVQPYFSFSQSLQLVNAFPNLTFTQPVFLTHSNDGTNRIFVVQKNGLIYVFPNDPNVSSATVFLNLSSRIVTGTGGDERGLLGLAFHPAYSTNGNFYVNYTQAGTGRTIVARYRVDPGNPNAGDFNSELVLINAYQPFSNHNGGMLFFGLDGYLYIGMGDGGSAGDPGNRAQNVDSLLGKILRINSDTTIGPQNYGIPPTNPFASGGGRPEIFAWGLRNPWRFSQDPVSGAIWCGDVGQGSWEEIDIIENGRNYGWRCYEGNATYNTTGCGSISLYSFPVKVYGHTGGRCSITGGYVYRGARRPELTGRYIYGDYCSREIWRLLYQGGIVTEDSMLVVAPSPVLSFGTDQFRELYVLCNNGIIYRFNDAPATLTVHAPNGGETWGVATSRAVEWSSSNLSGSVTIELSRNGGGSYETLFGSTENDGMEEWVVTGSPTANALVRVSSVANPSVQDVSDSPFTISPQFEAFARVHVRDGGMDADSMEFGTGAGATDGIDELFGEQELPPPPPVGAFDIRWQIAGTQGAKRDIRDTLGGSRQQVTYTGRMQPGPGGYPFHLRWDRLGLPSGGFTMRYQSEEGPVLVDMKQADSLVIADASVELFQVIYTIGDVVSSTATGGWNVVSLPVRVGDRRRTAVFPTSVSNAFAYTPLGYASRDTLDYGVGYWLKFAMTQGLTVTGELITEDTIEVVQGWNIIGSISSPVVVTGIVQIPSGIVVSPYYGYSATGYAPASVLEPMKGYWVKVSQNGTLVLNTSRSHNRNPLDSFRNSSRLTGFRR